jgi:hypothetical protein
MLPHRPVPSGGSVNDPPHRSPQKVEGQVVEHPFRAAQQVHAALLQLGCQPVQFVGQLLFR